MDLLRTWYDGIARNNQLALLLTVLAVGSVFVVLTAGILAPFYAAVTIAYVLQVAIDRMQRAGLPHALALAIAFGIFVAALLGLLGLIPLLLRQVTQLTGQFPTFVSQAQDTLQHLPQQYPALVNADQVEIIIQQVRDGLLHIGERLAGYVGVTVIGFVAVLVYLIIVPIMVFFLLKDKDRMIAWVSSFLPEHRELAVRVWVDVHRQLQNFVGGKVLQVMIVATVSYIVFSIIGLNYASLLAAIIGVSVLIPYIGPAFATIPVAIVATLEWGFTLPAAVAIGSYAVIHALDGNVLVPLLFAEAVAIHPVAIISAILFFGGIWGLWGVFFAIPLAVLVKAVIQAWPRRGIKSA